MKKFTLLFVSSLFAGLFFAGTAWGQIALRGTAQTAENSGTTITINVPAGVQAGDVMFATISNNDNDAGTLLDAAASAAGWILIDSRSLGTSGNNEWWGTVLYRVATSGEPASYSFSIDADSDGGVGAIVAFSGVSATGGVTHTGAAGGPFDVTPGIINGIATDNQFNAASITTVSAGAGIVMLGMVGDNNSMSSGWSATSPATLNELFDVNTGNGADNQVAGAWANQAAAGATGQGTATISASDPNGSILLALKAAPPTVTVNPPALSTSTIIVGQTLNLTATRSANASWPGGNGNFTFDWSATGPASLSFTSDPNTITGTSSSTTASGFTVAGTYNIVCTVTEGGGGQSAVSVVKKVNVLAAAPTTANLWATSSSGTQVSGFVVANGTYFSGPTNIFAPTFTGTGGGSSTAALGRSASPTPATGTFYYLPNNTGNSGVVTVYGRSNAGTIAQVASFDVNGGSTNSLGFVRLGMHPDGSGYILAGDGTTLYLARFVPSGADGLGAATTSVVDASVSLVGGAASTFQNGDLCISGSGTIYALANDGSGVTQLFTGDPNGASTTLTKKFDLLDEGGAAFTGSVNGVAFDIVGSIYLSTASGLYYVDAATVNGPAGTVGCFLVTTVSGLQDLASNVFPSNILLPVTLGAFNVVKAGDFANVSWKTLTEENTSHFVVERSYDGVNFTQAATQRAVGNSTSEQNYQYSDPLNYNYNIVYYRLKSVDIDGKFSYSKIVAIRLAGGPVRELTVFPNPFTDNVKLQMNATRETAATLRVSNAAGQVVLVRNIQLQKGDNIIVLSNGLEALQPGLHILEVISSEGKVAQKIIKR